MNTIEIKTFEDLKYYKLGSNAWGKPNIYVYCFLLDGLLIDTGQPRVEQELIKALKDESIDRIILTHHHEDHSGNIEAIKKLKAINAYGSNLCCELMKKPKKLEPARWVTWGQNKSAELIPFENDVINTEKYQLQIIPTPGHAIDQISLYEKEKGWLFSGDLFIHDYVKVFMRPEKIDQQIHSIKKLLELDFDVLMCNHQPKFSKGKVHLQAKLNFLEDFYGKVADQYHMGKNTKAIMEALQMKEDRFTQIFSLGQLSKKNMVNSVIEAIKDKS